MAAYTTIDNPQEYFDINLRSGTGSEQTVTGMSFQPDMIWSKLRSGGSGYHHAIVDSVRGGTKKIFTSGTNAESTDTNAVTAFNSDGYTYGSSGSFNLNSATYVHWAWKESVTAGFDINLHSGDAVEGRNISHSLSAVPHVIIVKNRTNAIKWVVYHHKNTSAPETDHLQLNDNAATSDDDSTWDDTAPGSSVFRIKGSSSVNGSSANYVSYLFTEKQGFSKFGGYTGNGNADGTFVPLSFRPAWLLIKKTSATEDWGLIDNKRDSNNDGASSQLFPNGSNTEDSSNDRADLLSNGFKLKTSSGQWNTDGASYIYMAFAEAPFVNSKGVPANAR